MMIDREWVRIGAEVVEAPHSFGRVRFGRIHKISKILKSGNFKVDGSEQQYRPIGGSGPRGAHATGDDSFYRSIVLFVDDVLRAKIEHEVAFQVAAKIVEREGKRLLSLASNGPDEEVISTAEEIDRRKPKAGETGK